LPKAPAPAPVDQKEESSITFKDFSSVPGGYATEVPSSWPHDEKDEGNESDPRYRSTWSGPDGTELIIDATPTATPTVSRDAGDAEIVRQPAFGSVSEYEPFSSADYPQCTDRCVLYRITDGDGGWVVLAGGGDLATARAVARRAAQKLTLFDQ